jgi:tRNA1Val (adenine37-N6)-methyltransferase
MGVRGFTEDGFLDGRIRVRQLRRGLRSGLDAVMLAAAVPALSHDTVLELGSGAGIASLCLAARVPNCTITGFEVDAELVSLANDNATANRMADRVTFLQSDVVNLHSELRTEFNHVFCNPPFHGVEGEMSPDESRALALQDSGDLSRWLETGVKRTASNGTFIVILRADRLGEALGALPENGVSVFPLWPKPGTIAKRVLIQFRRGKRTPLTLLPGLTLHEANGRYTPEADSILRNAAAVSINSPQRPRR